MAGISLSGLVSGSFNWQSVVDQLIQVDSAPITRLQNEETKNNDKLASFASLKTKLGDLQTAAQALQADGLFNGRTAVSTTTGSTWSPSAAASATLGSYAIAVSQLATASHRDGTLDIGAALSSTTNVSAVTLANAPLGTAATAGIFTVNGKQVTVALTDSLQTVFDNIATATGNAVTGSYDPATDKITLSSASPIVLGAANDTSNFLSALKLANNGTGTVTSSAALGTVKTTATLASANLKTAITAVDAGGNGTFSINGVALSYNVNTDTLAGVIARINASTAGVTAAYDAGTDQFTLTNKSTGDTGLSVSESAGGLLGALGYAGGGTLTRGLNAQFTVNGGATRTSLSNTLDASALGVAGLSVTVNSLATQTITVAPNTAGMKTAIQSFIDKFNAVQSYIDDQTKITVGTNGKVTTATLADNHEIQSWASSLRSYAFNQVSGLTGTIKSLDNLGVGFASSASQLSITDSAKLDTALSNAPADVIAFVGNKTGGFAQQFDTYLGGLLASSGGLATQTDTLTKQNTGIDAQIATIKARLDSEREQLTNAFLAMQKAQSQAQQMQQTLTNMFSSKSSSG